MGQRDKTLTKREFVQGAGTLSIPVVWTSSRGARAQSATPLMIGVLNTFTRAFSPYGEATLNGLNLYFEQNRWTMAGRRVEIIREDDEQTPQTGLQKLRKLIESDKVDIVCGPLASNVALAMVDYMRQSKCLWFVTGAGVTELTWTRLPYMFRSTLSNWQVANPMGGWAYDNVARAAVLTGSDFATGRDTLAAFKASFTAKGGKVLKEIFPPLGTTDFSAYLADIRGVSPPATYNFYGGTDSVRFVKQYAEYGLKSKSRLVGYNSLLDNDTFPGQGSAALDGLSSSIYCDTLDTPANNAFVEAYRAKFKAYPSNFSESGYTTALIIDRVLRTVGGDVTRKDEIADATLKLQITVPRGPIRFNPKTHQLVQNVYVRKVVRLGNRIANVPIVTIPEVQDPEPT
jgi:branched-chain amino acid transport system substrate-binding protein